MDYSTNLERNNQDEISLVDLAAILVKRRRVLCWVFGVVSLMGIAYAMLATETYQYTSLVQLAERGPDELMESPATVIETVRGRWIPEQQTEFKELNGFKLPFNLKVSSPEGTGLILITTETSQANAGLVKDQQQALISAIYTRQVELVERVRNQLNGQIAALDKIVAQMPGQGASESAVAVASAIERRGEMTGMLLAIKDAEVLVVGRKGVDRTGPKRSLIIVLSVLLGGMLGVFLVFFVEFAARVRSALAQSA